MTVTDKLDFSGLRFLLFFQSGNAEILFYRVHQSMWVVVCAINEMYWEVFDQKMNMRRHYYVNE